MSSYSYLHQNPGRRKELVKANATMARIAQSLLTSRKAGIYGKGTVEEESELKEYSLGGKDLLSALVKSNTNVDVPESQRISDEDVKARE